LTVVVCNALRRRLDPTAAGNALTLGQLTLGTKKNRRAKRGGERECRGRSGPGGFG